MTVCGPRPKNASTTREAILQAARAGFLRESYDTVGLREIAAEAGVDVALVSRYFGGKEGLFRAVLSEVGCDQRIELPDEGLAEAMADAMLHKASGNANLDRLMIVIRSSSSPHAAAMVRDSFRANVLNPVCEALDGPDREMRAALALSCMLGGAVMRGVLGEEPLAVDDMERVRARLIPMFRAALASASLPGSPTS